MSEKILVAVAWPYASSYIHVGNVAGAYLPADIFARYQRLIGNDVLMVSGSDSHGTPITVKADEEGLSPREVFQHYHQGFLDGFIELGLAYDLFTHTDTENHHRVAQDIFLTLLENGYLSQKTTQQLYCEHCHKFLPDRYVYGACPHCGSEDARGDQCEACGHPLDAIEIIDPACKLCGHRPVIRETEHFFLDLPALNERLLEWVQDKTFWRPNVYNFTLNYLKGGLLERPITRDMKWGIPVPVEGYGDKSIYVWFEAVIGYLAASVEWARITGQPEKWKEWWYEPGRSYNFIAKDNIPFHSIIWPAILMGTERLYAEEGSLNLPYDVPSNEFLNLEGRKISGSRNWAVWLPDYLERYDPDPLRYYLTANAPESRDTDFSWSGFLRRNNDELVATWGNLVNRVLTFAYKNFDQQAPAPSQLDEVDQAMLDKVEAAFEPIGQLLDGCKFKAALGEVIALAHEANRYLNEKAPWLRIKEDREAAGGSIYVALRVIDSLKTLFYPFLPFSSQELHHFLGYDYDDDIMGRQYVETLQEEHGTHQALCYDGSGLELEWAPSQLTAGQALRKPKPLFKKLDESIVEEELARLGE